MGNLLKNIVLFLIPVLIVIMFLPVNKRFAYQGLKDDCSNHGIWIYDRIYNNPKEIDIAFLGSSRTMNGVDDQLISDSIPGAEAVNFGYCRFGRNLNFVLLKEIVQEKNLKILVLEVREYENLYSHPVFPFIAQSRDVVLPNPFFHRTILADAWTHFAYKIELTQDLVYQHESSTPVRTGDFGFGPVKGTAPSDLLDEIKQRNSIPKPSKKRIVRDFNANFARGYLGKINRICRERGIGLFFLYLPSYGSRSDIPEEYDTYLKYGEVWIPPDELIENHVNWYDGDHLNEKGAEALSRWIAGQLNLQRRMHGL